MLLALATLAIMLGTAWTGWVAVPLIGLLIGALLPHDRPVVTMAVASPLGWGILLLAGALRGPVGHLADVAGAVVGGVPGVGILLAALLFPALLGVAAAGVGAALRDLVRRPRTL